jgi:hypothetical protein
MLPNVRITKKPIKRNPCRKCDGWGGRYIHFSLEAAKDDFYTVEDNTERTYCRFCSGSGKQNLYGR